MAIFRLFNMAAAAMLDFSNFKFLTIGRQKRAELRRRAKFGRNRSICGRRNLPYDVAQKSNTIKKAVYRGQPYDWRTRKMESDVLQQSNHG